MQTALMKAIEQIQQEIDKWESQTPTPVRGALLRCREICKDLLPTEREVIEEAYDDGINDGHEENPKRKQYRNAQHYFNTKFNQNADSTPTSH